VQVQPYLQFDGRAEEAINFYKSALGATVCFLMRFKDSPEPPPPGTQAVGTDNKVMHSTIKIGESAINLSDGRCSGANNPKFDGFSLSILAENDAHAQKVFNALADGGGKISMPLTKTFFSSQFGMVNDRFGVSWMVYVPQQQ
jgi:PhnB protein